MKTIYNTLLEYREQDICPMHMPGHKRNSSGIDANLPFAIDITEINGFDNLHDPEGIIKQSQDLAATLYHSEHTFYLVNGSTCGILAGVRAVVKPGDKIIMSRNAHKSVYHAVELNELNPVYLIPKLDEEFGIYGSQEVEEVKEMIQSNLDAKLIILTSPSYEGVISDIKSITEIAHSYQIPVLVDEAHGAHLGFSNLFCGSAVAAGADIVINSIHKTLPALTQTALCHVNGKLVSANEVKRQLSIFETSSPSYVLLASIDACIHLLANEGKKLFNEYEENLKFFSNRMIGLKNLKILNYGDNKLEEHKNIHLFDKGKLIISSKGTKLTGNDLALRLREEYNIELEMAYSDYAIAMTSIFDTKDNFILLSNALLEIDSEPLMIKSNIENDCNLVFKFPFPKSIMSIHQAMKKEYEERLLEDSVGRISREYVYFYPPGIPILVPGEQIDMDFIQFLKRMIEMNIMPKSSSGKIESTIEVIKVT